MNKRSPKPAHCKGCALYAEGNGFWKPSGTGGDGLVIIGDLPWIGASLTQLERLLRRAGLNPDTPRHSVISCYPPSQRVPTMAAMHCSRNVDPLVASAKVVVVMGELALQRIGGQYDILRWRGRPFQKDGRWIIPTLHPRDLLQTRGGDGERENDDEKVIGNRVLQNPPRFVGTVIEDLKEAKRLAEGGAVDRPEPYYLTDPSPVEFLQWLAGMPPDALLAFDIETAYGVARAEDELEGITDETILRVSFSYAPHTGVSIPWNAHYMDGIREALGSANIKVGWNCDKFDVPLIRKAGVEVKGEVWDMMWAFHLWQSDLPMGLEFASGLLTSALPWKHLASTEQARYSAIDADVTLRCAFALREKLTAEKRWDLFLSHVVALGPVLREAGARGSTIDLAKRDELRAVLSAERDRLMARVQEVVPDELKPKRIWKRKPETGDVKEIKLPADVKACSKCGKKNITKGEHLKGGKKNPCHGAEIVLVKGKVSAWEETLDFNPNSSEQIKAYIRHFGHPMGYDQKDRTKESANAKHLVALSKRFPKTHPVYGLTVEMHKVAKILGTYVYEPDENGKVHTTYDHTPSTGRLASKNINLQNVSKRGGNKWGKEARKQLIASPGCVLVQADSSAIEAVFVGWFMGSPVYIDLARKSIHAYLACRKLGIDFTPENVKLVKSKHGMLYDQCKMTVHGSNYGMGAGLMVASYPDLFPTRKDAEDMQRFLFDAVPGLRDWQQETRARAHKDTFLQNPWGYRHYFWNVFTGPNGNELGTDAKRSIAFLPQSSAGAFAKDTLLVMGETKWREYMPAHVSVHDSYCLDVPKHLEDEAVAYLGEVLTRPIPQMDGLRVGCEIEVGLNWGSMKQVATVTIGEDGLPRIR